MEDKIITYGQIAPYLKAFSIKIRDRQYRELTEQEAKRRMIDSIQAGHAKPDILIVVVK